MSIQCLISSFVFELLCLMHQLWLLCWIWHSRHCNCPSKLWNNVLSKEGHASFLIIRLKWRSLELKASSWEYLCKTIMTEITISFVSFTIDLFRCKICQSTSKTGSESEQSYNILLYMMNIVCHSVCGF